MQNEKIRNIAIIAHVDHGKTSLLNELLKQGGVFRENQEVQDRVVDSNDLERERGITILAKNTSAMYKGVKLNIIDTPGHADFGGEVERVLKMADGVLLVVDAYEGPMPQTRFVLEKALALNLKVIVVINKIDKENARLEDVGDEVLELLLDLEANEEQLESPIVYCSARNGTASTVMGETGTDMKPLFETILSHIPAPTGELDGPLQMLVSATELNEYVGKLSVGKITRGSIKVGQSVTLCNWHDATKNISSKVVSLLAYEGLKKTPTDYAEVGDIVCIAGLGEVLIGDTVCDSSDVEALPFVKITEPSVEMSFLVNDSPLAGKEGKFVTSRNLRDRLYRESIKDLSLKVTDGETTESFKVCGRGEMHLSILVENMRREGYEFQVSMPKVLIKEIDGHKCEPIDRAFIDVPDNCVGAVMSRMGERKGELISMKPQGTRIKCEFLVPSRGLFGYKSQLMTDTKGEGILNTMPNGYDRYKGDIVRRTTGSLVSFETAESVGYGLFSAQDRGDLFIGAGVSVYEGMIVGRNPKNEDIVVNVCKKKKQSNVRSSGADESLRLVPPIIMSLEECMDFIGNDELLEVTPKSLRIRKRILSATARYRNKR